MAGGKKNKGKTQPKPMGLVDDFKKLVRGAKDHLIKEADRKMKQIPLVDSRHVPRTKRSTKPLKDGVVIVGEEVFHEVWSSAEFESDEFLINPSNVLLFPTVATAALAYTKARIRKCTFHYTPTCPATTDGQIALCYVDDPRRNAPGSLREVLAYNRSNIQAVWAENHLDPQVDRTFEFFLKTATDEDASQLRLSSPGYLVLAKHGKYSNSGAKVEIGFVSIKYEVELFDLRAPDPLSGSFFRSTDQSETPEASIGGTNVYALETPDTSVSVGYFGHSDNVTSETGTSIWKPFQSLLASAGEWGFRALLDYGLSLIAADANETPRYSVPRVPRHFGLLGDEKALADHTQVIKEDETGDLVRFKCSAIDDYVTARHNALMSIRTRPLTEHHALVHKWREQFTPFDACWVASWKRLRDFMRANFGFRSSDLRLGSPVYEEWVARIVVVSQVPGIVDLSDPSGFYVRSSPMVAQNITIRFQCVESDGTTNYPKTIVVSSEDTGARTTANLELGRSTVLHQNCRVGVGLLCPDTHQIVLRGPSATAQAAANDSATEIDGCRMSASPMSLAQATVDFDTA